VRIVLVERDGGGCVITTRQGATGIANCGALPLRLGLNVLSKLHLYLAIRENVLYFTAADATNSVQVLL
jgi:hypothetical protein